jgi:hypothetical protein
MSVRIKKISEALSTKCQTPDLVYNIDIDSSEINISLKMPFDLDITEEEAILLEKNIHNSLELVMSRYFLS